MAPVQCPRCWIVVGNERGLEIHLGSDTPCQKQQRQPVDGICPRKLKLLKSKKRLTPEPGDEAKWTDIYRILFPGVQPIPSPCKRSRKHTFVYGSIQELTFLCRL
jgi:hypothetical protein